jgi:predicted nucleic acid-binding protein
VSGYLLDTTVFIQHWRLIPEVVAWVDRALAGTEPMFTTAVNVAETYAGARPDERAFWEQFFAQFNVLPVTAADGVVAGQFRYARGRLGRTLHLGDALVAAVAFNAQLAIVTANPKDLASLGLDVVEVG